MPIMEALDQLHYKCLVHSDVRNENLVYSEDSKLIYFDLCDYVDVPYPETYNCSGIDACHPFAVSEEPRKIIHDQYAILYVIKESDLIFTAYQLKDLEQTIDDLKRESSQPLPSLSGYLQNNLLDSWTEIFLCKV